MKILPHVAWQMVGRKAVVLDLASGRSVGLNPTGSFVWERLARGDADRLVGDFAAEFQVSVEVAERDVRAFVDGLVAQNLVAPEP